MPYTEPVTAPADSLSAVEAPAAGPPPHPHTRTVIIEPRSSWRVDWGALWDYRELLGFLLWRDTVTRYRQMALGSLWIVLRPLLSVAVFSLVFGRFVGVATDGSPYPLFSFAALLPWTLFQSGAGTAAGSLVSNMQVISKVYFPRLLIPLSSVLAAAVDYLAALLVFLGVACLFGYFPTLRLLALPLYLLLALLTALCMGLWCATFAVRFRDINYGLTYLLQALMFLSPVVYSSGAVPERWRTLFLCNPMAQAIEGTRWSLLGTGRPPDLQLALVAGALLALTYLGACVFHRTERSVVDYL